MKALPKLLSAALLALLPAAQALSAELLNASYDVSRTLYQELNPAFIATQKAPELKGLKISQSHGGSSKQARSVIDGLEADVVTMNNPLDIDAIAKAGLLKADWASQLPKGASPSWSPILFLVRKGNPKGIKDWGDLIKPGVSVVIPNPKTSGNGRYSFLAAYEWARRTQGGDAGAERYVKQLFAAVPVLDSGGRGATTSFAQRNIGDVLLSFENELRLTQQELAKGGYEIVVPSLSVRADNPVAVVDKWAAKHGNAALAKAYLQWHFSAPAQELIARNSLRPVDDAVLARHAKEFPAVKVFRAEEVYGSWAKAQAQHFADGGTFDRIYSAR